MKTIEQFCAEHEACRDGRKWALANCRDMQHAWETIRPDWLIWIATQPGVLTDRELRLFAVWCARQVQHLMTDQRSIAALDVAERHANGNAADDELAAALASAWDAARAATEDVTWAAAVAAAGAAAGAADRDAALASAWDAAGAADRDAALASAWDAAGSAAKDSAGDSAGDSAWDAARAAARDAQAAYLRANTKPNFA